MVLSNLGMMVAVFLFLYVNILGCVEIMHQQFRQQQVLERLGMHIQFSPLPLPRLPVKQYPLLI